MHYEVCDHAIARIFTRCQSYNYVNDQKCHPSFPCPGSFQEGSFNIHFISICTVVQLSVKLNRERKVQSTDSFFKT